MAACDIRRVGTRDARFGLPPGAGTDSVHTNPVYSYAVTLLESDAGITGTGLAFTLGGGNDLVCQAIAFHARDLEGRDIEEVMADFGALSRHVSNHPQYRWLGPHKGVVHLALASITNACFDLWAKARGVPLWKVLTDLEPTAVVALLDLSGIEDVLTADNALALIRDQRPGRGERACIVDSGYPGYDTSVGWFDYTDDQLRDNVWASLAAGFTALKLKVGSDDPARDVRRAYLLRELAGPDTPVMLDANQKWSVPEALAIGRQLSGMSPFWIEEPTHPDDILGHQTLVRELSPIPIAMGEHVPNRVVFKNYMQLNAARFIQVDAVRVAGISEFITISLMARTFGLNVVPHVGDMGQIHQHLVLFNHIALGHETVFLEHIPHLREHFVHSARIEGGRYRTPQEPGSSSDLH